VRVVTESERPRDVACKGEPVTPRLRMMEAERVWLAEFLLVLVIIGVT
jgi:hypothetical protein